ncbi:MAG: DUF1127 domain-containing protein [Tabrizicola sp.]|nr:DUF1127 domain-containing protein [Tabrizicola sp.]
MAYVNTTRTEQNGILERLLALKEAAAAKLQQRRIYSQTISELMALSDRELDDLGIARFAIRDVAHEAAYGK